MTRQEIFDIVYTGLAAQGWERSVNLNTDNICAFRNVRTDKSGQATVLKCAIGQLIPDEIYNPRLEFMPLYYILFDVIDKEVFKIDKEDFWFFLDMQARHDDSQEDSKEITLRKAFDQFGEDYDLTIPKLN